MLSSTLPAIGVLESPTVPGMNAPEDSPPLMTFLPLDEALETRWQTDAHFVGYRLVTPSGETGDHPRLNKPFLGHARNFKCEIISNVFALDADTPNHVPWTEELFGQFMDALFAVFSRRPEFALYTALYTTQKGARIIYALKEPLPADEAESRHRFLVSEYRAAGLMVDPLSDWTRLFRLPRVIRNGALTDAAASFLLDIKPENRLDAKLLPALTPIHSPHELPYTPVAINLPMPTPQEVMHIKETVAATGYARQTPFMSAAKRKLKGRDCYGCCFEGQALAAKGSRDSTIHAYVGQAISLLIDCKVKQDNGELEEVGPQHIYALFYDAVAQLEPDEQTQDWTVCLWRHVCRIWGKEQGKLDTARATMIQEIQGDPEQAKTLFESICEGMQKWCNDERLYNQDPLVVANFVRRYFIATSGKFNFIINKTGRYDPLPLYDAQIIPFLRTNNLEPAIPTKRITLGGGVDDLSVVDIKNAYSYPIAAHIELEPEIEGGYVRDFPRFDRPNTVPMLVMPCYRRNPHLKPEFSEEVDQWLRVFFDQSYDDGCRWLAWALAFDLRETCALSLQGVPGAGKKLLVQGLAECLERPHLATGDDIVGEHQYGLAKSPFVSVNEGWPAMRKRHPADGFRSLVSGDETIINMKYLPPMVLKSFPRVVFTANNYSLIFRLTEGRNLTNEDREALSQRLLHIEIGKKASSWLQERGGYAFTGTPGRRWIANKGNHSDFVLARHFLYLYANRGPTPQTRFLVQGNASEEILFGLQTQVGDMPYVIETVLHMLKHPNARTIGLIVEAGRMLTTPKAIVEYHRTMIRQGKPLDTNTVLGCLKSIGIEGQRPLKPYNDHERQEKWWALDVKLLRQAAHRDGWDTELLDHIIEGRNLGEINGRQQQQTAPFGGRLLPHGSTN